jgi:hypothetical protein
VTSEAIRAAVHLLFATVSDAAVYLGVSPRSVRFWMAGDRPAPEGVQRALAERLAEVLADPSRTLIRLALDSSSASEAA